MVISRQAAPARPDPVDGISLPSSYLSLLLEDVVPDQGERHRLLADAGIRGDDLLQPNLPLSRVISLVKALDARLPTGWHIAPCLEFEPAQHGPVGLAAISARSLGEALVTLQRFERLRAPWARARLYCEAADAGAGQRQVLEIQPLAHLAGDGDRLLEMSLLALAGLIASLLGPHRGDLCLEAERLDPAGEDVIRRRLGCQVHRGRARSSISLPRERLAQACLLADPELHELMVDRCQRLLQRPDDGRLTRRVLTTLAEHGGRNPGARQIASRLGLSERSLSRHLAAEGTSYRRLIDQNRYRTAREWLRHSTLPVATIAARLGYNDPANFNRAFRRWAGISPGAFRQQQADD
jgi:AraC-like DNA-binding protein